MLKNIKNIKKCIRSHLDISTAHITKNDDAILRGQHKNSDPDCPLLVDGLPYGYRVHIDTDAINENAASYVANLRNVWGFSEEFCYLILSAEQLGCDFIIFDSAGSMIDRTRVFDW